MLFVWMETGKGTLQALRRVGLERWVEKLCETQSAWRASVVQICVSAATTTCADPYAFALNQPAPISSYVASDGIVADRVVG